MAARKEKRRFAVVPEEDRAAFMRELRVNGVPIDRAPEESYDDAPEDEPPGWAEPE